MFKKLIETESEQKTELQQAQERVKELETEVQKFKMLQEEVAASERGDTEAFQSEKLQEYVQKNGILEKEIQDLARRLKDAENELKTERVKHEKSSDSHRKSISTLHTNMFKKLLDAEDEFEDKLEKKTEEFTQLQKELQREKIKNDQSDKLRRDSVQTVHNQMLTKMLDAQAQFDEDREKLEKENKELKTKLRKEMLKSAARSEKNAEKYGIEAEESRDEDESDISDMETEDTKKQPPKDDAKFDDLWDEADEPLAEIDRLKGHIEKLERELKDEKEKTAFIEKQRKYSIHNLHNNMFQKLLDAEFEYEEEIERLHKEKEELNEKIDFYEQAFQNINNGDDNQGTVVDPTEYLRMKDELKQKSTTIQENKAKIFDLTKDLEAAQLKWQNEEKQRRSSVSFLSKQMMAKLLEAEEENEDQKAKFKQKLQRLEKELEESKEMSFNLEKTRRNSVTKVSQGMFAKLLSAEQSKKEMEQNYKAEIKRLEELLAVADLEKTTIGSREHMISMQMDQWKEKAETLEEEKHFLTEQMEEEKKKSEKKEKERRQSFSALQNSYWTQLLQAEDESTEQIRKLKHEIVRLQDSITDQRKNIEWLTASKCNLLVECEKQINDLRRAVQLYNRSKNGSWF